MIVDYNRVVDRLIMQFKEYESLAIFIAELEQQQLQQAVQIAQSSGLTLGQVMAQIQIYPQLQTINNTVLLAKLDQQRLSDEMSFQNHIVWMTYKYKAYSGTPSEIATVGAFQRHCSPRDYICTKRYNFLKKWLLQNGVDIEDTQIFSKNLPLDQFYSTPIFTALLRDNEFLGAWKSHEYYMENNTIAKWKDYHQEQCVYLPR